eukprot:CAMPEP_0206193760 /NCGR_PEP_ID=MMETSP0166-20121206/6769_1 /ASSEMBLY_ACC=CAM_ASM_000260 /TAXON_ID=95228 /ORGANISM="Vannella robusta, Strain DIVA3 518/3/11/1/6" /LENGTH=190 /DNA_ID=CAMNT_0053610555 /DNA_START=319 /DNA_END=888 /DNA_ORIENTATION=+
MEMLFALLENYSIDIHKKDTKGNSLLFECIKDEEYDLVHKIARELFIVVTEDNYHLFEEYLIDIVKKWPVHEVMSVMEKLQVTVMYEEGCLHKNLLFLTVDREERGKDELVTFMLDRVSPSMLIPNACNEEFILCDELQGLSVPLNALQKIAVCHINQFQEVFKERYASIYAFFTCATVSLEFTIYDRAW